MTRDYNNLEELREVFRARMKDKDFCIGEEQVEKLFRELLGEPEPPEPEYSGPSATANEVAKIMGEVFTKEKIDKIFERHDTFHNFMKGRK